VFTVKHRQEVSRITENYTN